MARTFIGEALPSRVIFGSLTPAWRLVTEALTSSVRAAGAGPCCCYTVWGATAPYGIHRATT
jgi:hypothetical protein